MSEEEKQEKVEETSTPEKPPEKAEKPEKHAEKKGASEKTSEKPKEHLEKKTKKISRMTLVEVEKELRAVQEKMGGFDSRFAQHLLARKKELASPPSTHS